MCLTALRFIERFITVGQSYTESGVVGVVAFQTLRPFPDPTGAALALVPIAPIIEIPVPLNSSYGSKRLNLHSVDIS